jgi:hypothetical protein
MKFASVLTLVALFLSLFLSSPSHAESGDCATQWVSVHADGVPVGKLSAPDANYLKVVDVLNRYFETAIRPGDLNGTVSLYSGFWPIERETGTLMIGKFKREICGARGGATGALQALSADLSGEKPLLSLIKFDIQLLYEDQVFAQNSCKTDFWYYFARLGSGAPIYDRDDSNGFTACISRMGIGMGSSESDPVHNRHSAILSTPPQRTCSNYSDMLTAGDRIKQCPGVLSVELLHPPLSASLVALHLGLTHSAYVEH